MTTKQKTFAETIEMFRYHFDIRTVFDDLLTMSICSLSYDPVTKRSHDEELYLETIGKYKDSELRYRFPELFALLVTEMEVRVQGKQCSDILGEYFELHLARKGSQQFFTPWPVCKMLAQCLGSPQKQSGKRLRIIDPACGSGRMLLAGADHLGKREEYYGIDIDHTCVKMTVLNLFLNGIFHAEVMCANALIPGDFKVSYRTSLFPLGVFRITERERSLLWQSTKEFFPREKTQRSGSDIELSSDSSGEYRPGLQLDLF